ncbi:MAG: DUF4399 domain-containing protein [Gammaproteobacteria bacterium]|nr:DUF4399 domain-containing protein [Gammaproteobacteria bacterium]
MNKLILLVITSIISINTSWSHGVSNTASTFIASPQNGAKVTNPITVKFGIKHFKIAPAGENIHKAGHYHLLIDLKSELSMDKPIPSDINHRHFDKGESETTISLNPGTHSLQLVVGDEEHEPFEELISEKIMIEVIK